MAAKLSFPTQHSSYSPYSSTKEKKVFVRNKKKYYILVSSLFMLYNGAIECHILSQSGFMMITETNGKYFLMMKALY
jgi:hypothetical protein